ncbi:NADPH-dependent F420 reductase [Sinosporangium siamense]|uniref:NADP oxidoreductase n=1 Tax=Sinosporangium siamense TaxID=1367973 RepID=A0A919RLP8_9ACTN|nr:NAD(P)-binding domain-containing protein [Sinosporangium siamense]GII96111.1 NADP oxidoreductase [Sinosporangium siamense]
MRIGVLGTGVLAEALGSAWVRAGHEVVVGGRSREKAAALAGRLGGTASAAGLREAVAGCDAVLLAVSWDGVEEVLEVAGSGLAGVPLIDPTNAVEHGVGVLLTGPGGSGAQRIAALAPGAHVVKAFNMFPSARWAGGGGPATVVMCGDDEGALRVVGGLVRDAGGVPAVLGPLARSRQVEEAAGFVIGLAFAGVDPRSAVPGLGA